MGDKDEAHTHLSLKFLQKLHYLGLDRDVEGGGRFVGYEQCRLEGQGHGDHDPLSHAARELVGIGAGASSCVGDADACHQVDGGSFRRPLVHPVVKTEHFADLVGHREHGVQSRQ